MGHPDRKPKRERRKQRQKMLARRNLYEQTLDLTPYNAVGPMVKGEEFAIKYKWSAVKPYKGGECINGANLKKECCSFFC